MKIKTLKGNKIYLTKTPCEITNVDIQNVLRIKMSCGGGMGGSSWFETVNQNVELKPNSLITVETIDGETKTINTNFMVYSVEKKLVKVTEVHENSNFKETMGKPLDYYYLCPVDTDVEVYQKYSGRDWCN